MSSNIPVHGKSLELLNCLTLSEVKGEKMKLEKRREMLNDRQEILEKQKNDMSEIDKIFQQWLTHLQKKVERNNQQVPYMWCIKDICKRILKTLGDRDGAFYMQVKNVYCADVPGVSLMCERLEQLRRLVTKIDQDEVTYKPGFVEDMHHILGALLGITGSILNVYF